MTQTARMTLTTVALADIHVDPDNIRDAAQDADISSLAADIAEHGLLQPLIIYPHPHTDGAYMISGGHRRYHALRRIGLTHTDANIIEAPANALARIDLMFSENEHRRQLNPIETAKVYRRYTDAGLTQTEISRRVKRAQSHVGQYLHLLTLSADVQRRVEAGEITVNHASKLVRQNRIDTGAARNDVGGQHHRGQSVTYFTSAHPLYQPATYRCRSQGHDPALRIGGACGPCWEDAIRADAAAGASHAAPTAAPTAAVETFTEPRELLRHVNCTRCGINALDRPTETRCASRQGGRLHLSEHHAFPMHIAAPLGATA